MRQAKVRFLVIWRNQMRGNNEVFFMRHKLLFLPFLVAIVGLSMVGQRPKAASPSALSLPDTDVPVVVELFTSQSCSSCPPADALLGELNKHPNIIAFSCHVTYWDHLDWRDTLSRKFCTERQRSYARHQGKRQVYTPQMVVNGEYEFVGNNKNEVMRYVSLASKTVKPIKLSLKGTTISATLPGLGPDASPQTLWLASYQASHTQAIPSGENRGKTITYTNSIATLQNVGTWDGRAKTLTLPRPAGEAAPAGETEGPGYALIAQPNGFGPIRAAGAFKPSPN